MILELDIGNTRCKWRLVDAVGAALADGSCAIAELAVGLEALPARGAVLRARAACVRGEQVEQQVRAAVRGVLGVEIEYARSQPGAAGVRNSYAEPARLGVDRWLAMLAGFASTGSAVCVFDCGSAITADLVDDEGLHRGGYIVPGIGMSRASLLTATDRVRFDAGGYTAGVAPGTSTLQAVAHGTLLAAGALLRAAREQFGRICPQAPVLLTGGDAQDLLPWLDFPVSLRPHLVLDGLRLALP
ncbi:MAG TPA: type III pantothenate kinase [Pseudomonadales bacterium]|nr:type III pantothenate kinase [Pseudomonadales bacterium]HND14924.1 type III pantothenate kinase [Pseudomonadales bacterium]